MTPKIGVRHEVETFYSLHTSRADSKELYSLLSKGVVDNTFHDMQLQVQAGPGSLKVKIRDDWRDLIWPSYRLHESNNVPQECHWLM